MEDLASSLSSVSAGQRVRQAEWVGECPSRGPAAATTSHAADLPVEYDKPWFEWRQGYWYCLLCGCWATDTHVACLKHTFRATNPTSYGFQLNGQPTPTPKPDYDRPWFEARSGAFYCHLCNSWATEGHLSGSKHQKREACPQSFGFPGYEHVPEAPGPQAHAPAGEAPMPEQASVSQATAPVNLLPGRWEKVWSSADEAFYFAHTETWITQWEEPAAPAPVPQASAVPGGLSQEAPGVRLGADWAKQRLIQLGVRRAPASGGAPVPHGAAGSAAAAAATALPVPWVGYRDPNTGKPYYHNPETEITQWEFPWELFEC